MWNYVIKVKAVHLDDQRNQLEVVWTTTGANRERRGNDGLQEGNGLQGAEDLKGENDRLKTKDELHGKNAEKREEDGLQIEDAQEREKDAQGGKEDGLHGNDGPKVEDAEKTGEGGHQGEDEFCSRYPYIWLRDCCQCEVCFHPIVKARMTLFSQLDFTVRPTTVQVTADQDEVILRWLDGHRSSFKSEWLKEREFTHMANPHKILRHGKQPMLWGAELANNISILTFDQVMTDDRALYDFITILEETGLCMISGAPQQEHQLHRIAGRIAYLRKTHYGETFAVKSKGNPSNLAYTTGDLGMHTDLAYNDYVPGVQLLHCIKQIKASGGENHFTDGFKAAQQLRELNRRQFDLLADVVLDFYDIGNDFLPFDQMSRHKTLRLDDEDNVVQVTFSNHARDSMMTLPLELVQPFYEALKTFYSLLYHKDNMIEIKMKEGDIVCFHNYRVLHSRRGFTVTGEDERHLEGGYIDWDEMHSKRRVLRSKLQIQDND